MTHSPDYKFGYRAAIEAASKEIIAFALKWETPRALLEKIRALTPPSRPEAAGGQSAEFWKTAHDRLYETAVLRVAERNAARKSLSELVHFARVYGCNRTKSGPCDCCDAIARAEMLLADAQKPSSGRYDAKNIGR